MHTLKAVSQQFRYAAMKPRPITEREALDAAIDRANHRRVTPRQVRAHIRATGGTSLGDSERLANVFTERERHDLWFAYQDTFKGEPQTMIDTVMADCHRRIAQACNAGELSLWPQPGGTP